MNNDPSQFTLYSGGHRGAEAEFGKLAEKFGVKEINFSFDGHKLERNSGIRMLNQEDLEKGNISMDIVSTRLGRSFSKGNKIRKVIQSIFHMVNSGYQIFVVGWILLGVLQWLLLRQELSGCRSREPHPCSIPNVAGTGTRVSAGFVGSGAACRSPRRKRGSLP